MASKGKLIRRYCSRTGYDLTKVTNRIRSISGPQRTAAYKLMRQALESETNLEKTNK